MDPLTPEEVTALKAKVFRPSSIGGPWYCSEYLPRKSVEALFETIRDRERELAELQTPPNEECWIQLITYAQKCGDGPLLINRITAEYIKMRRERDELQRKLSNMTQQRDDCEKELEQHATNRVNQRRELIELQRRVDELKESLHITIGARDNWKAAYDLALTNEVRWMKKHGEVTAKLEAYQKLAAPVREGEGGTE